MSGASVPRPLNRTWGGAHTPKSPRTVPYPCILHEKSHIPYVNYNKEIKVENVAESAKIVTNVQTFRDFALHQWNVR